jgi:hypothetical protein
MMHLTVADKSLIIGDRVAVDLVHYAAYLGKRNSADDITIRAIGIDGAEVNLMLLLNSGVTMAVESTTSVLPEPDNDEVIEYMQQRMTDFEVVQD